jgi:OmcA/MtrC family decaheme c-type cytochrome
LNGVLVTIKEVTNTGPGQKPTVRFALTNKDGPLAPTALETLTFTLTGPNDDFEVNIRESNAMSKVVQAGSDWAYTFTAAVPADAEGSYSVGAEGRITVTLNGASVRDSMENPVVAVAVTDAEPEARRMIVDDAKCESCHANLSLHGDNRKNSNVYCQTCHMPDETDAVVRLEGLDESIHFKYMVHKIHRGADLENGYVVYGFRNSVNDYSEVGFPGDLRDCEACHVEGTYGLPLPEGALPTYSPNTYLTEMGPMTATCLSCHDGLAAASHADANTSSSLGESCDACHGDDKTYSVERVHAR